MPKTVSGVQYDYYLSQGNTRVYKRWNDPTWSYVSEEPTEPEREQAEEEAEEQIPDYYTNQMNIPQGAVIDESGDMDYIIDEQLYEDLPSEYEIYKEAGKQPLIRKKYELPSAKEYIEQTELPPDYSKLYSTLNQFGENFYGKYIYPKLGAQIAQAENIAEQWATYKEELEKPDWLTEPPTWYNDLKDEFDQTQTMITTWSPGTLEKAAEDISWRTEQRLIPYLQTLDEFGLLRSLAFMLGAWGGSRLIEPAVKALHLKDQTLEEALIWGSRWAIGIPAYETTKTILYPEQIPTRSTKQKPIYWKQEFWTAFKSLKSQGKINYWKFKSSNYKNNLYSLLRVTNSTWKTQSGSKIP